jgi:hypothetical protein
MQRTERWLAIFAGVAIVVLPSQVGAQPPSSSGAIGVPRATFSPYLNLTRSNGSLALNYYGLVRPELQFRQSLNQLQGSVATNQQLIGNLQSGSVDTPATGHPVQFLNHGGFFLNNGPSLGTGGFGSSVQQRTNTVGSAPKPKSGRTR